jgi:hypothetical protein
VSAELNPGTYPSVGRESTVIWATVAMLMAAAFVLLLLFLHVVRTDRWVMAAAFFALAATFVTLALALMPTVHGWLGIVGLLMLVLGAVGAAMGGMFPMDPIGTSPEHATRSGMLHGVSFMIGVPETLFAVTLLCVHLWRQTAWRSGRGLLAATSVLVWLTMVVFGVSMAAFMSKGATGTDFLVGWQNRALVLSWAIWVLALSWKLRKPR